MCAWLAGIVLISQPTDAGAPPESLGDADWRRVERGEPVVVTRPVKGYPWPEVTVYRRVAASPEDVMAVYTDFEGQVRYLPELVTSRVVARLAPGTFQVFYEYEVSGPNERYTVAVAVARLAAGLEATWNLLSARYARRLSGRLHVEPFGTGALITYSSRVDPGTLGIHLGSPASVSRRLLATTEALAGEVERLRLREPETLAGLRQRLGVMLQGVVIAPGGGG